MALQYPSFAGLGVDAGGIMDAFDMGFDRARAQKQEKEAVEAFGKYIGGLGNPPSQQPMSLAALGQPPAQPQTYAPPPQTDAPTQRIQSALGETQSNGSPSVGQMRQYIAQAAMQRGIDPGVAIRVAESEGLAPGVWQSNVMKNGRRETSYGPFQLLVGGGDTGLPEGMGNAFAAQTGLDPSDPKNWQQTIDFALDGASKNGWGAWYGAAKAGIGNRQGIGGTPQRSSPVQMADASGQVAIPQQQLSPLPDADTMRALFAAPGTRQLAIALAQSRIKAQSDPMAAIEYQTAVEKLNQLRNPKAERQSLINAGEGRLYDPNSGQWITAPGGDQPDFRQATPEEAAKYGSAGGQFGPDGRFYPINPPSGMTVESSPDGGFRVVQGSGAQQKPLTEGQSKDAVFATRAEGALPDVDKYGDALTNPIDRAKEMDPTGVVRGTQAPEFQKAKQAGDEFLQAILRKDTGAAITSEEMSSYGKTYLPMPGDSKEVLQQKQVSRKRALEALKAGMPPQAILNQEEALRRSSGAATGQPRQVNQQEYEALPSGAEFIAPDGSRRRKP